MRHFIHILTKNRIFLATANEEIMEAAGVFVYWKMNRLWQNQWPKVQERTWLHEHP